MIGHGYEKASKYPDLYRVYSRCSGPGGLKLTEFIADRMDLRPDQRLLDIGIEKGLQTCFLAKEYGVFAVGIDPDMDRTEGHRPHIDFLMENARELGVEDRVMGVRGGVPDTGFPSGSFDRIYCTTTLEMIRGEKGPNEHRRCLDEIYRVLKHGGIFGMGEPMHKEAPVPEEMRAFVSEGNPPWERCFSTLDETITAVRSADFEVLEAGLAEDSVTWWEEYAMYDPYCQAEGSEEKMMILMDKGRWLSFGYVIAKKP